jgi:hypothetical protein
MGVFKAGSPQPGQRLETSTLEAITESSRRLDAAFAGETEGIRSQTVGAFSHTALDPEIVDPIGIRQSFFGQIVDEGPNEEDDYEGSTYWVRELLEVTPKEGGPDDDPNRMRLEFKLLQDIADETNQDDNIYVRWVTATNLAEVNLEDPEAESHGLVFDSSVIVRVWQQINPTGVVRWYFSRASGGGIREGVVRNIYDGDSLVCLVQLVTTDENDNTVWMGDPVDIACWRGLKSKHYRSFEWPLSGGEEDPITDETQFLPIFNVDGVWRIFQYFREAPPEMPFTEWPHSDCTPWKFEEEDDG